MDEEDTPTTYRHHDQVHRHQYQQDDNPPYRRQQYPDQQDNKPPYRRQQYPDGEDRPNRQQHPHQYQGEEERPHRQKQDYQDEEEERPHRQQQDYQGEEEERPHRRQQDHQQASSGDLMSSAKLIAEAAKYAYSHETDKVDTGRVAGAAADLLGAAKQYGKLGDAGVGKYLDQAENYLHKYNSSHSINSTASPGSHSSHRPSSTSSHHQTSDEEEETGGGGGGYGNYIKMAEGFLKKH